MDSIFLGCVIIFLLIVACFGVGSSISPIAFIGAAAAFWLSRQAFGR